MNMPLVYYEKEATLWTKYKDGKSSRNWQNYVKINKYTNIFMKIAIKL